MLDQARDHQRDEAVLSWIATRLGLRCGILHANSIDRGQLLSPALVHHGIENELGGLIWELTPQSSRDQLASADRLRDLWLQHNSAHLARLSALIRHWPSDAPAPLLFKGADLELHVYGSFNLSPGCRMSSDWDLIVPDPTYQDVLKTWTQRLGSPKLPRSARLPNEPPHEVGFNVDGLLIEVHRDPAPRFFSMLRGVTLWERAAYSQTLEGFSARQPTPIDRLLLWLVNYAKAGGLTRALSWVDLTLILIVLYRHNPELFAEESSSQAPLRKILKSDGLYIASREALTQWVTSPLADTCLHVSEQIKMWLSQEISRPELHFKRRLTPTSGRLRLGVAQFRLCAPSLRAQYLRRALLSVWTSHR